MEGNKVSNFSQGFYQNARKRRRRMHEGMLGGADVAVWKKDKKNETLFIDIA